MKTLSSITIAVLTLAYSTSAMTAASQEVPTISRAQAIEDLEAAIHLIKTEHAAPFAHIDESEWSVLVANQKTRLPDEVSLLELHRRVGAMTTALGCAHSFLNLSGDYASTLNETARGFPEEIAIIGGRLYFANGSMKGREILSINSVPSGEVFSRMSVAVPVDGFGRLRKGQELARRFAYYYATQVDPYPERFMLEVEGRGRPLKLEPTDGLSPPSGVSGNSFLSVERGSSGPIVLTLGGFYDQDADGQFQRFLSDASKAIAKDPDRALILDLRGNPGGLDAFGVATIQLLASKPFTVYEQITATPTFDVDYVETKRLPDGTQVIMGADGQGVTPAPDVIHRGPLFVLVDQRTGSTATDVASHLDAFEGAVIIGQETIGAYNANSSGFLNLHTLKHSKAQLYLPQLRYITSAASSTRRHRGVLPDVPIDLSPEDLSSGRDAVMETARALANY